MKKQTVIRLKKEESSIEVLDKVISAGKTRGLDPEYLDYASTKIKKELRKGQRAIIKNKELREINHTLRYGMDIKTFIKNAEKITKKVTRTKRTARNFLIKHGFYTKDGKLHPDYGG